MVVRYMALCRCLLVAGWGKELPAKWYVAIPTKQCSTASRCVQGSHVRYTMVFSADIIRCQLDTNTMFVQTTQCWSFMPRNILLLFLKHNFDKLLPYGKLKNIELASSTDHDAVYITWLMWNSVFLGGYQFLHRRVCFHSHWKIVCFCR